MARKIKRFSWIRLELFRTNLHLVFESKDPKCVQSKFCIVYCFHFLFTHSYDIYRYIIVLLDPNIFLFYRHSLDSFITQIHFAMCTNSSVNVVHLLEMLLPNNAYCFDSISAACKEPTLFELKFMMALTFLNIDRPVLMWQSMLLK